MRTISGIVNDTGNYSGSTGFSSRRDRTGVYTINFNPRFRKIYGASATQVFYGGHGYGGDTRDNLIIVYLNDREMRVRTGRNNGEANDRDFTFVVNGE